jgi:hypothetical protein
MWNTPGRQRLAKIPRLYETEHVPLKDKLVHLHFFIGGSDWFVCEYDGDDMFFGYCILNNDLQMAEWGYAAFSELKSLKINGWVEVDCELEAIWKITKACEVELIRKGNRWKEPEQVSFKVL